MKAFHVLGMALAPSALLVAGCGGRVPGFGIAAATGLSVSPAASAIDTNMTTHLTAARADGEPAHVAWSVTGGDPVAGAGSISPSGVYTPPSYLTSDSVTVTISARQPADTDGANAATTEITVRPGFLQPLTPGNLSVGANGSVTLSASIAEVGGLGGIRFILARDHSGTPLDASSPSAKGSLSGFHCERGSVQGGNPAYTVCSVTYSAPSAIATDGSVYIVGTFRSRAASERVNEPVSETELSETSSEEAKEPARSWSRVLLNAEGIDSNPAAHQARLPAPVFLGSSTGNNSDYDSSQGLLSDCCGGTLGALIEDTNGNQFVLSNNHILARSDQSMPGETIIQPGLIDNGCTPYGIGPGTMPVASLTGYPLLASPATNVDAAIARVTPGLVDPRGNILELGARQPDGYLAAAPPGTSSTAGKGEIAALGMMVAKSGRTTGLTCTAVSAINVDVTLDYFSDCAENSPSMSKTFTNQIAFAGVNITDAGDSGALVVDASNAEPVGVFFAGGTDVNGVEQAMANPAEDVLAALDAQVPVSGTPASYRFVGGADHPVSCLNYSAGTEPAVLAPLSEAEHDRANNVLPIAQFLAYTVIGASRTGGAVSVTASKDRPGDAAIAFPLASGIQTGSLAPGSIPASIAGVTTALVSADAAMVSTPSQPRAASLAQALAAKQRNAASLMKANPSIFGVGIGQSLDNPADAAIVIFADRKQGMAGIPRAVEGQRVRIILMDRLHVTRAHGTPAGRTGSCLSPSSFGTASPSNSSTDPFSKIRPLEIR